MLKAKVFVVLITVILISGNVFAQEKCMFVASSDQLGTEDTILYEKLVEWGYDVDIYPSADLAILFPEEFDPYDFMFVSETIGSGDLNPIKTIPVPMVLSEGWAVKPTALDWQSDRDINNFEPQDVKIVDNTGHILAAGFTGGATVTLVTAGYVIASVPQIPIIPIAVLTSDETKQVIYGVEAGTQNVLEDTIQSKVAVIGVHAEGYETITDDAWKFFQAGIDWVLGDATPVQDQKYLVSSDITLHQNFPNPFNPKTEIAFSVDKNMHVNLNVYNAQGQLVETVLNEALSAGSYTYSFHAQNLPSGVYYYKLQSENDVQTRKMILMK